MKENKHMLPLPNGEVDKGEEKGECFQPYKRAFGLTESKMKCI